MQCPDCGAFCSEEDEFCGECGLRLSPEASGEPAKAKAEPPPAEPVEAQDLPGDRFQPTPPTPPPVRAATKKNNLLPAVIAAGGALLLLLLGITGAIVWFIMQEEPAATPPAVIQGGEESVATPPVAFEMPGPGELLYQDTFDDPGSGWSEFVDFDTATEYEDGGYQITIYETNYMAWGNPEPGFDLDDLIIDVDVRQVEGPLDNNFGILVRYSEDDDLDFYYWFQISADGFYSVDLYWRDEWVTLVEWEPSTAIRTGLGVTNQIRVVCMGHQFSFYANDVHLVDLYDDTLDRGSIGLAAGAFEEAGVVVRFDDLRVYELGK